jgi:DNA modification methylase
MRFARLICGDALAVLRTLPAESVHCCVTSPPYWGLRDYGTAGQLGLERSPAEYLEKMVAVFEEVWRVLRPDGTCWVNMGDCYATGGGAVGRHPGGGARGHRWVERNVGPMTQPNRLPQIGLKPKDLTGMPWRLAFVLQDAGWYLRRDIIWSKPNPMPESVTDRPTTAHEYVFLLTRSGRYFYDAEAVREGASCTRPELLTFGPRPENCSPGHSMDRRRAKGNAKSFRGGGSYTGGRSFDNDGTPERETHGNAPNESLSRNLRSVWTIATSPFPEAHFATFPPALAERCIRAGTSESGCCSACGAPWVRKTKVSGGTIGKSWNDHSDDLRRGMRTDVASLGRAKNESGRYRRETSGFIAGCACAAEVAPCTVLDPFSGAGTTALVALRLGRQAIGIELKPEYCEIARRRIEGDAPLLNRIEVVQLPTVDAAAPAGTASEPEPCLSLTSTSAPPCSETLEE